MVARSRPVNLNPSTRASQRKGNPCKFTTWKLSPKTSMPLVIFTPPCTGSPLRTPTQIWEGRAAQLAGGGMIGIRAPMHNGENAVTRPYMRVKDIEAAVAAASEAGAEIAVPPMKIPGHGTCAIYIEGGVEGGLWQP